MMEELKIIKLEGIEYIPRELYDTAIVAIDQLTDTVNNLEEHRKMIESYSRCNESQSTWHTPDEVPEKEEIVYIKWDNPQHLIPAECINSSWYMCMDGNWIRIPEHLMNFLWMSLSEPSEDDWKKLKGR